LLFAASCKKEDDYTAPVINIISPEYDETTEVPGNMHVVVRIISERALQNVRISVDDQNIQPIYEPKSFSPEEKVVELDFNYFLGSVPPGKEKPFYLHVSVDDGTEINHEYQRVKLANTIPQQVIGYYLYTRPSIGKTRIDYYDFAKEWIPVDEVNGEYVDGASYSKESICYVATSNQSVINAYRLEEEDLFFLKWQHFPELPFAEITDLYVTDDLLYAGTGNGIIDGLDPQTGTKKLSTDIAQDSVPGRIGASPFHIVGDFYSRKDNVNAIQSFFQASGVFIQRRGIYYSVIDFYPYSDGDSFYLFGTTPTIGLFARYHVPTNMTFQLDEFNTGAITHSCRVSENEYIFAAGSGLHKYIADEAKLTSLINLDENIVDMVFDDSGRNLYLALANEVRIYTYPDMVLVNNYLSEYPIKGLRIRFYY
jgi:hypothetical protein